MNVARCRSIAVLLAIAIGLCGGLIAEASPPGAYGHLPLSFEPNRGQTDPSVEFVARSTGYQLFLTGDEAVLVLRGPGSSVTDAVRMTLAGAKPGRPVGVGALPGTVNYLIGRDPTAWRTGVPTYARVLVPGVYPGIDLVYYGQGRQLEYDFILGPGADPSSIRLSLRGLREPGLALDTSGDLRLRTSGGDLLMKRPVAYQMGDDGTRRPVDAAYVLVGSPDNGGDRAWHVSFALGAYDRARPLVIDPILSYAAYLGGTAEDAGMAIAVRDGEAYVTGYTDSLSIPPPPAGTRASQDAFVAKLNASGTALVYVTYLGGSGDDAGMGIAVDASGQAYVTGYTSSTNFPTVPALPLFESQGGRDAFVVKVNAAGSGFAYSTYLGGEADDAGLGIAVDAGGSAHVTGWTDSDDFPTTSTPLQGDQALRDAFVTKLSPGGTALVYSTYLGGNGDDEGHAIALDTAGKVYVTGGSTSTTGLPTSLNTRTPVGGQDAFVAKLDPSVSGPDSRLFLTYIGGGAEDAGRGVAADSGGLIYVTGTTASGNFPIKSTAYQSTHGGGQDAFVAKFNPAGTGPNTQLMYSTFLGGAGDEAGLGLALDEEGQVYITGFTTSSAFPTREAADTQLGGARDAFVAKLDTLEVGDPSLRYSTYLGGTGADEGYGIAVDAAGHTYVAGLTRSGDFPGAVGNLSGPEDAFVARLSEPDLAISDLTAPATAGDGGVIHVTAVTRNNGVVSAGPSTTSFFLSVDSKLNVNIDTFLGSHAVPALAAGEANGPQDPPFTLTLPTGLAPATYYLFAMADADNAVGESLESNNKTKREIAVGADLVVSTLSVTSSGASMTVTDTTRNGGGAAAAASTTKFFMSSASGEVLLGSRPVETLAAGAATAATPTTLTIPAGTPAGSFTVIARADADLAVVETSEDNNTRSTPFSVGVDLVVATLADVPSLSGVATAFTVKSTTKNEGFIASGPSTTVFYLSPTAELDATAAISIGTQAIPGLAPGATSAVLSTSLTVPAGTPPGAYFVVAKANGGSAPIVETRTTNNTRARATLLGPDLIVYFVSPASVTTGAGRTFLFKDTMRNLGGGDAPASLTKYHLSVDATYDAADVELGQRAVKVLAPRASDVNSAGVELTIPASTAAGSYFLIVRANAGPTPIGETNTTNNVRAVPLTVAGIDLVVSALTVSAGPSSTLIITDSTTNQGTASAGASATKFYFSTDDSFSEAEDTLLGSRAVGTLAAGATSQQTTTVPLPAGTAPGQYTVFARADADNAVAEADESNNRRARSLDTRGSDVIVSNLVIVRLTGTTVDVSDTTRNEGPATAGASTTRIYLSLDTIWDPADVPLGPGRSVVSLAAASQSTGASALTIPATTAGGDYFVIARADDGNVVGEVNEGNNTATKPITIRPDLTFSEFNVPATAASTTVNVDGKVSNDGAIPVGPSVLKIFLSTDDVLDGGDALLATRAIEALAPTRNSTFNIQVTLPEGTTSARIIGKVDADDQIGESNETNNTRVKAVALGSDLIISAFTGPNPAVAGAGSTIVVRDTTRNRVAEAGATTTRIYLATQAPDPATGALPAGAVALGSRSVPALGVGKTHSGDTSVIIPPGTGSGVYFMIAMADADRSVAEGNETNNATCPPSPAPCPSGVALSLSIVIGPDLVASGVSAPAMAEGSATITVTDTITNQGGVEAGASTAKFYLSTNTTWEPADVLLGSRTVGALGAGAASPGSTPLSLPAGTAPGTYHVIARADADGAVSEVSESNNTAASGPILIGADLTVTLSVPLTTAPGATITVSDTVTNIGGAQAGESVLKLFLSTEAAVNGSATFLGSRIVPALGGGGTSEGATAVTIPVDASAAVFFLVGQVDANGQVAEVNEANNSFAAQLKTGPDLQVTALTGPIEGAPGAVITIKDTTKNAGARTDRVSVTTYYLSVDAVLDAGDLALGSRSVPQGLAFNATSLGDIDVTLPANLAAGTYHIIAKADATNVLVEALEDNNVRTRQIAVGADLIISAVSGPSESGAGKTIEVGASTKNQGAAAGPSVTEFYLSVDDQLSGGDRLLGSVNVLALGPNATRTASTVVTIPSTVATVGRHFIIARANGNSAVGEVDTTNNTRARPITLGPDLVVPTLTVQSTGGAGLSFTISDTTRNDAAGDAPATATSYYLSADSILDSEDVLIGGRSVPPLGPGASSAATVNLTLPPGTPAGTYQVFARADATSAASEVDETNNTRVRPTKIGPDLVISSFLGPTASTAGSTILMTVTVGNQGAGNAVAFHVRLYLSTDDEVTPGVDVEVGNVLIGGGLLAGASTGATSISARLPTGTPGAFTLIAVADADGAVAELSDVNNQKTRSLRVDP